MDDEILDVDATRRVAQRALVSAVLAFIGGGASAVLPFPHLVTMPFLVVALVVGISAVRTLNHPDARVIGGLRHFGIVLAALGAVAGAIGLVARIVALVRG